MQREKKDFEKKNLTLVCDWKFIICHFKVKYFHSRLGLRFKPSFWLKKASLLIFPSKTTAELAQPSKSSYFLSLHRD